MVNTTLSSSKKNVRAEAFSLLKLSLPLCIAQIASISILTADIWMMGQLSAFDLAAGGIAVRYYQPFYFFSLGILSMVSPLIAQALGAKDPTSARRTFRQGLILALLLGILCILPVLFGADILPLLGQDPQIAHHASTFLTYSAFGLLPSFIFMVMRFYTSSFQRPAPQMVTAIIGLIANIILNYLLTSGAFGLPEMGLGGIALATSISHGLMALVLGVIIQTQAPFNHVRPYQRWWVVEKAIFRRILTLGLPHSFLVVAETGMFIVAGFMIGLFGTAPLAASAVVTQIAAVCFMIPLSVSQATAIRIGNAAGRGDVEDVIRTGWTAIIISLFLVMPGMALLIFSPQIFIPLFLQTQDSLYALTVSYLIPLLMITGLFQIGDAQHIVLSATLRGLNDTKIPALCGVFGFWGIGLGSAWVMGFQLGWGPVWIWTGIAIGLFATSALLGLRWIYRIKLMRSYGKILADE